VTEAALTHLLRTALAKSSKEAAAAVAPLATAPDTQRLRKHMQLVLERLAAGQKLSGAGVGAAAGATAKA
jgi:Bardet-Biedl syndrome 9 protein